MLDLFGSVMATDKLRRRDIQGDREVVFDLAVGSVFE